MTDILHAAKVTKRFGGLIAVNNVEFSIPERSIVSLIGPNGAGKTTFFNIIAGIYDPTAGRIEFGGTPMIARPRRAWLEPVLWVLPPILLAVVLSLIGSNNTAVNVDRHRGDGRDARPRPARRCVAAAGLQPSPRPARDLQECATERHGRRRAGADVPEHPPVREHDRSRERPGRDALPAQDVVGRRPVLDPARSERGAVIARSRPGAVGSRRPQGPRRSSSPRTCRTATSAGSRSPAPWAPARRCSCSTSRPPG